MKCPKCGTKMELKNFQYLPDDVDLSEVEKFELYLYWKCPKCGHKLYRRFD